MNVTNNEKKAMISCLNYNNRENQLSDNYSNCGVAEFRLLLGWNSQQVGGLITSLKEKGLAFMDGENDILWLTEKGVNFLFDNYNDEIKNGGIEVMTEGNEDTVGEVIEDVDTTPVYRIKINYKSGNSEMFWATEFKCNDGEYSWDTVDGFRRPIILNVDAIESVWQGSVITMTELKKKLR